MVDRNLPIRVLLVEDDEDDFVLIREAFNLMRGAERTFELRRVEDFDSALSAISDATCDVCIIDYRLGERSGLELLELFPRRSKIPVIFITGQGDYEVDIEAMRAGAADYLTKDRLDPDTLERCIRNAIEREQKRQELLKAKRVIQALSECNNAVIHIKDEVILLHEICRMVVEAGGYRMAWVGYAEDDEERTVTPVARYGHEEGYLDAIRVSWMDNERGRGPAGMSIRTALPCMARSVQEYPGFAPFRAEAMKRGYASVAGFPLFLDGRVLGCLAIYASEPDAFDGEEVELLTKLAGNLSHGIGALRAHQAQRLAEESLKAAYSDLEKRVEERTTELRKQNEYLAALHEMSLGVASRLELDELLDSIITHASALVGTPHGFIYTYDSQRHDLEIRAGVGEYKKHIGYRIAPGVGMGGVVWQTGRPLIVGDYAGWEMRSRDRHWDEFGSVMGIPLKSGARVRGVIGLAYVRDTRKFGAEELDIVQRFAALASIALDNAQLYHNLQEELQERKRAEAERERLQSQLIQAQKLEAMGTLAGGIAHDFNNILLPILGYTEMALDEDGISDRLRYDLEQVLGAASRAKDLVKQILAFSRMGKEQTTAALDMSIVVKEALKLLKASLPSTIEIRQHIERGIAVVDATQIHQVIINLCTNASHAMDGRGVLDISLRKEYCVGGPDAPYVSGVEPGPCLRLSVTDTGHGMDAETLQHIFEPYFTTKEVGKGTGLGLAVVHGIVKRHGGGILVRSEPGTGSTFDVFLPMVEDLPPTAVDSSEVPPSGTERILIVDDEPAITDLAVRLLERYGYRVTAKLDVLDALALFSAQPSEFDLLITDCTMPRMTGIELAAEILKIRPDMPIVLCTGFSEKVTAETAKAIGIKELVLKPFNKGPFVRLIRDVLDRGARAPDFPSAYSSNS